MGWTIQWAKPLDRNDIKTLICYNKLTLLCQTVQSLGKQMQDVRNLGK